VKSAVKLPALYLNQLGLIIVEIETAGRISELSNCRKLKGFKTAYRIRMGQYRMGFYYEGKTIELVRILHRKEIYTLFP